jgi:hypothetical protein
VLDVLDPPTDVNPPPDVLFTHCGGKDRLDVVVKALRELAIPLAAVGDFDLLHEEQPLRKIFESLGGDWAEIAAEWRLVKYEIELKKPALETPRVKEEISAILSQVNTPSFPSQQLKNIERILKQASAWAFAKESGRAFVPSGNATVAFNSLLAKLEAHGLYIVEVGELEMFDKSIGGHGPKWVNLALRKDLKNAPELQNAREFVQKVVF